MEPLDDGERADLAKDSRSALLAGSGLGLALLGVVAIPIAAVAGLGLSYLGWRSARPAYRTGRIMAIIGMALGFLGSAAMVVRILVAV